MYASVFAHEFETEDRVRPIRLQLSPENLRTKEIVKFFEPLKDSALEFGVKDDLVAAKLRTFEDFVNAIWYSVNRVRKRLHDQEV